jgi:hypothetical protein
MKKCYAIIAAMSLMAVAQSASAQLVLFSDNFTAPDGSTGNKNLNLDLGGGRLGGTLAPGLIVSTTAWYNENGNSSGNRQTGSTQLGNTAVNAGQPTLDGNYLMSSGGGFVGAQTAFDVAALGAGQAGPLTISLDMYVTSGNTTDWGAIALTTPGVLADATNFFMIQRDNGGVQVLTGGSAASPGSWDSTGFAANGLWTLTFSDTAGTGSAFVGNGSQVKIQNGANTLGTLALSQLPSSGLELDLAGNNIPIVFDNVSITTVPEPSTYALAVAGLVCLALVCRYRRVIA